MGSFIRFRAVGVDPLMPKVGLSEHLHTIDGFVRQV
jgi:hypothetical protein